MQLFFAPSKPEPCGVFFFFSFFLVYFFSFFVFGFFLIYHVRATCLWCWSLSKGDITTFKLLSSQESHFASAGGGEISWLLMEALLFRWDLVIHLCFLWNARSFDQVLWSCEITAAFLRGLEVVFHRNCTIFCWTFQFLSHSRLANSAAHSRF